MLKTLIPEIVWPKYVELSGCNTGKAYAIQLWDKIKFENSDYELPERKLCDLFINKNMNVIELGGSLGILSTIIASKISLRGTIVSVEASEKKHQIAKKNLTHEYPNIININAEYHCTSHLIQYK